MDKRVQTNPCRGQNSLPQPFPPTTHYVQHCRSTTSSQGGSDKLINHNPDGGVEVEARATRIRNTAIALKSRFPANQIDKELWDMTPSVVAAASGAAAGDGVTSETKTTNRLVKKRRVAAPTSASIPITQSDSSSSDEEEMDYSEIAVTLPVSREVDRQQIPIKRRRDNENLVQFFVRDQSGNLISFVVKKTTRMIRVFEAYAEKNDAEVLAFRFLLDGERIESDHTPKMLEIEDGDQINVMLEQGGC